MQHPVLRTVTIAAVAMVLAVLLPSCATGTAGLAGRSSVARDFASEYYAIAEGYAEISKFDKAIVYYRKAALRGEYANAANYGLGRMYALSGKWQEACDTFDALHEKDPDNTLVSTAYAYALASNGQKEEALVLYEAVWRKNGDDPRTGRNYAAMLVLAARYEEALSLIATLKEKYPNAEALKNIGELEKKAADALKPPADAAATADVETPPADASPAAAADDEISPAENSAP